MRKMKGYIPTMLLVVLVFGSTIANAGIIVNGRNSVDSQTSQKDPEPCKDETQDLGGIIVNGIAGAASFFTTGIIVNGIASSEPSDETCGIIVNG
jgi:hypothetical protein